MSDIVSRAEETMDRALSRVLSTSQLRKFLAAVNSISNQLRVWETLNEDPGDKLPADIQSKIKMLKVKLAYQAGRHKEVKEFANKAKLFTEIDEIKDSRSKYHEFANYIEALVAYHKFEGGR